MRRRGSRAMDSRKISVRPARGCEPPATELEEFGHGADQRDDADQDAGNEQYGLRGHFGGRLADASISVSILRRKVLWTEGICR